MKSEGFPPDKIKIFSFLDLRYLGQSYEITIPYQPNFVAAWVIKTSFCRQSS